MSKGQYVGADEAKLDEIIRQAESRLQAQLSLAVAADQRAMSFASILVTGAAALIAWAITHDLADGKIWPILVLIIGVMVAAGCALWSANPVSWNSPGNSPESWIEDIAEGRDDLKSAKAAMANHYSEMIGENTERMSRNADWLGRAMLITFGTLVLGGITAMASV